MVKTEAGGSQEPGASSRFPTMWQEPKHLGHPWLLFQSYHQAYCSKVEESEQFAHEPMLIQDANMAGGSFDSPTNYNLNCKKRIILQSAEGFKWIYKCLFNYVIIVGKVLVKSYNLVHFTT